MAGDSWVTTLGVTNPSDAILLNCSIHKLHAIIFSCGVNLYCLARYQIGTRFRDSYRLTFLNITEIITCLHRCRYKANNCDSTYSSHEEQTHQAHYKATLTHYVKNYISQHHQRSKVNINLYSASTQTPLTRSDMDHTVLPANNTTSAFTPQSQSITALW